MTSSTRCLVLGLMLSELVSTLETVWYETPASRATSRMFGARTLVGSMVRDLPGFIGDVYVHIFANDTIMTHRRAVQRTPLRRSAATAASHTRATGRCR